MSCLPGHGRSYTVSCQSEDVESDFVLYCLPDLHIAAPRGKMCWRYPALYAQSQCRKVCVELVAMSQPTVGDAGGIIDQ
jgi:hypothetical protein